LPRATTPETARYRQFLPSFAAPGTHPSTADTPPSADDTPPNADDTPPSGPDPVHDQTGDLLDDSLDDSANVTYRGSFEYLFNQKMNEYVPLSVYRNGEERDWDMEEILFLLNSLDDDWHFRRPARYSEHGNGLYQVTFVPKKDPTEIPDPKKPVPALRVSYPMDHGSMARADDDDRMDTNARCRASVFPTLRPRVEISIEWIRSDLFGPTPEPGNGETADPGEGERLDPGDDATADPRQRDTPDSSQRETAGVGDASVPQYGQWKSGRIWSMTVDKEDVFFDKSRGRTRTTSRNTAMTCFEGHFPLRESSNWLRHSDLLLLCEPTDFSPALLYFVDRFPSKIALSDHEHVLSRVQDVVLMPCPSEPDADHSVEAFLRRPGWLDLTLVRPRPGDHLDRVTLDGTRWSIVSGTWVHPRAPAILENNRIDGLIMDTTFRVIRLYHTAVLVAVSHNVGIPLAIAFGAQETVALYQRFYTFFDKVQINLRTYILESDQGRALISIGADHPRHLFCLHHVLRSLSDGCGRFAPLVGNLIRARSQKELDVFFEDYTPDFLQVCEAGGTEKKQLDRCLLKVGLAMGPDSIVIADDTRWSQVSMLKRIGTNMPSTTNTIESLNGHMNDTTPRNNTLWGALIRIEWIFTHKIDNFDYCVRHNLRRERRQVLKRLSTVTADRMRREVQFFETRPDSCSCGQTALTSPMYEIDIPCSHRVFLAEQNGPAGSFLFPPEAARRQLSVIGSVPEGMTRCVVTHDEITVGEEDRHNPRDMEVDRLVGLIVKNAHAQRRKKEVREFVDANLREGTRFALQESDSFWEVHRQGVADFRVGGSRRAAATSMDSDSDSDSDSDWYAASLSRVKGAHSGSAAEPSHMRTRGNGARAVRPRDDSDDA
jgi:hypothetical protein